MMISRCLYCYEAIDSDFEYHDKCASAFFGESNAPELEYTLSQMHGLAQIVVDRSIAVTGAQPKLSMSLISDRAERNKTRLTVVGALGGGYILKPPSAQYVEMPENEHLTMRLAELFGINVVSSTLIRLSSGELAYLSKRIDRNEDGSKIHMLDMFQITEAFDKYRGSMEMVGRALGAHSVNPLLDKIFFFDLTLFCYLTGNNDMHLKNFSMIKGDLGWVLSPAYDLLNVSIVLAEDKEELALSLGGKRSKLKKAHFEQFGIQLGLSSKQIKASFVRISKAKTPALNLIERSFLSPPMKEAYKELLSRRYLELE